MKSPQEALEAFADKIEREYESWYASHEFICRVWYMALQSTVLLVSIATALVAALSDKDDFAAWGKYVLVALPIIASVASSLLGQARVYDIWKLREQGRIAFQDLAIEARRRAAGATADECKATHAELQKRLTEIETAQSQSFYGFITSETLVELKQK